MINQIATEIVNRVGPVTEVQSNNDASIQQDEVKLEIKAEQQRSEDDRKATEKRYTERQERIKMENSDWRFMVQETTKSPVTYAMIKYADEAYNTANVLTNPNPRGNKYQRYA